MSKEYNKKYKKGKFLTSKKAWLADLARTPKRFDKRKGRWVFNYKRILPNTPSGRKLWQKDTRKYDLEYVDTGTDFARSRGERPYKFKYKARSKIVKGRRRYWYKRPKWMLRK